MKFPLKYSNMRSMFYYNKPTNCYAKCFIEIKQKNYDVKKKLEEKERSIINLNQYAQYSQKLYN